MKIKRPTKLQNFAGGNTDASPETPVTSYDTVSSNPLYYSHPRQVLSSANVQFPARPILCETDGTADLSKFMCFELFFFGALLVSIFLVIL